MLTFKMTSLQYFGIILVQISPNNKRLNIFLIYLERALEKFLDPLKAEKFKKQKCNMFCWTPCDKQNNENKLCQAKLIKR